MELDESMVEQAAALGLSYQAAVREAMVLWLGAKDHIPRLREEI